MRRISSHIQLIAALVALCLAGQTIATVAAWGAPAAANISPAEKAALDKQVQEAIAKGKLGQSAGTQGAGIQGAATGAEPAGGGLGSSEAFSNLTHKAETEEEEEPATQAVSTTASSGISSGVLVPIFVVGGALLVGIAFLIVRDARNVAPAGDGFGGGSSQDRAVRMRKRRAKSKAARRQRKRNR
jgi:hypothetical protein